MSFYTNPIYSKKSSSTIFFIIKIFFKLFKDWF